MTDDNDKLDVNAFAWPIYEPADHHENVRVALRGRILAISSHPRFRQQPKPIVMGGWDLVITPMSDQEAWLVWAGMPVPEGTVILDEFFADP